MNRDTLEMLTRLENELIAATPDKTLGGATPVREQAREDAAALRKVSMTLHRWHELECGVEAGHVERDGENGEGKPFFVSGHRVSNAANGWRETRTPIADREAGAKRRLAKIMARYPTLKAYIQGDPRGCALYILRPGDVPNGESADAYYSRGVAVYK